jgi:hypothetical protein
LKESDKLIPNLREPVILNTPGPFLESERTKRMLVTIIIVAAVAFFIVGILGLVWSDRDLLWVSGAGVVLQIVPFWFIKRGYIRTASFLIMLGVLGIVVVLASVGQGSRDAAVVAFPIVLVFSGLALDRKSFVVATVLTVAASCWLVLGEAFNWYTPSPFAAKPGWPELITLVLILIVAAIAIDLLATNARKNLELARQEIEHRKKMEEEREKLITSLQKALSDVKTLSGLIPICCSCKKIRDDQGYWKAVEQYIGEHTEAEFTHGICPDCIARLYPDLGPLT